MFAQFNCVVLMLIVASGWVAGEKRTKTDIPCAVDSDCDVNSIKNSENDVTSLCIENFCEFSVHAADRSAPETMMQMQMVTVLGGKCHFNEECNIDGAICLDNLCTCANETVSSFSRRKCLTEAKEIGNACVEDIQCNFPQTTCRAGRCDCEPGFGLDVEHENKTQCKELNGIGHACHQDADCEVEHTKCNANHTCVCVDGYSGYQRECYEISVTYLSKCDVDFQCQKTLGPDAICINSVCHCLAKHIFSVVKNRCVHPTVLEIRNHGTSVFSSSLHLTSWMSTVLMLHILN